VECAVPTLGLQWNVPYLHKVYSGKCRTYARSTVESAVPTQGLQWKVQYLHKVYSGKFSTYTRSTLERAVPTQVQRESSVCDRRRRVVLNISQTTFLTQTDVFLKEWFTFLSYLFRTLSLAPKSTSLKEAC
jgi:hypothetical protein